MTPIRCLVGLILGSLSAIGLHAEQTHDGQSIDWTLSRELASGIRLVVLTEREPRPLFAALVRIDLATPGLRLTTSPRRTDWVEGETETDRQTTRDFLRDARRRGAEMVLAFNGDAFSPWPVPYAESTPTDLLGLAIADEILVSRGSGRPALIVPTIGPARLEPVDRSFAPDGIAAAIGGFALCLERSKPLPSGDDLEPRTGVGIDRDGRFVFVAIIDGRQPASHGATTEELGHLLARCGAVTGLNLDGGGSTSLVWWDPNGRRADKARLLNRPVGNSVRAQNLPAILFVPTERAVGNSMGVVLEPR